VYPQIKSNSWLCQWLINKYLSKSNQDLVHCLCCQAVRRTAYRNFWSGRVYIKALALRFWPWIHRWPLLIIPRYFSYSDIRHITSDDSYESVEHPQMRRPRYNPLISYSQPTQNQCVHECSVITRFRDTAAVSHFTPVKLTCFYSARALSSFLHHRTDGGRGLNPELFAQCPTNKA